MILQEQHVVSRFRSALGASILSSLSWVEDGRLRSIVETTRSWMDLIVFDISPVASTDLVDD
jgi:hypothetical protein